MIKDTNRIPEVIKALEQLDGSKMRAGILDGGKLHMIAHVQEYGATITAKNAKGYLMIPMPDGTFRKLKSVTIPSRPFIARTVIQHSSDWRQNAKSAISVAISGGNVEGIKQEIANKMSNDIKQTMQSGGFAANAPLTVERKGSSQPLIDTGALMGAVRGEVER